jgi:SAM-dependent methyltransferase
MRRKSTRLSEWQSVEDVFCIDEDNRCCREQLLEIHGFFFRSATSDGYIDTISYAVRIAKNARFEVTLSRREEQAMITSPAFDYDTKDHNYANVRRADPRIGQYVTDALRDASTILNVGAGTGSYEPFGKYVLAVEPSSVMRQKRLANGKPPGVNAKADSLPFDDKSFDAAMMVLTIHHWPDLKMGLEEVKRVTRNKIVILTYDPNELDSRPRVRTLG